MRLTRVLQVNIADHWEDLGYSGPRACAQRLRQLAVDFQLPLILINTNPLPDQYPSYNPNSFPTHPPESSSAAPRTMASPSAKKGNDENIPIRSAPSASGVVQPSVTSDMRKLNSKKAKSKARKAKKAGTSNDSESTESASASTAAASVNASAPKDNNEDDHGSKQSNRAKKIISRHEKRRKQEFKVVKRNRPHFTDAQAWAVVDMVDRSESLQDENARDKLVLSSESDSDWDEEKLATDRGLTRYG